MTARVEVKEDRSVLEESCISGLEGDVPHLAQFTSFL